MTGVVKSFLAKASREWVALYQDRKRFFEAGERTAPVAAALEEAMRLHDQQVQMLLVLVGGSVCPDQPEKT